MQEKDSQKVSRGIEKYQKALSMVSRVYKLLDYHFTDTVLACKDFGVNVKIIFLDKQAYPYYWCAH